MTSLKTRVDQLETAAAKQTSETGKCEAEQKAAQLAAIRTRCQKILEIEENPIRRAELLNTIRLIDAGKYDPEPIPTNLDEKAKMNHAKLMEMADK